MRGITASSTASRSEAAELLVKVSPNVLQRAGRISGFRSTHVAFARVDLLRPSKPGRYVDKVPQVGRGRRFWWWLLVAIIVLGVLSRVVRTGSTMFDKYLGDALYAAMVYVILRLTGRINHVWLWAGMAMIAIEFFQLTGIPAAMFRSEYAAVRVCGRLLGTEFSVLDLLAYAVGIACIAILDRTQRARAPVTA